MNFLKRTYIWCRRFRHRKGYGVHSPFAYNLITDVIQEQRPFYFFDELKSLHRKASKRSSGHSLRVEKLLFRLSNWWQPELIIEFGNGNGVSVCALASGNLKASCIMFCQTEANDEMVRLIEQCKNAELVANASTTMPVKELHLHPSAPTLVHVTHTANYREACDSLLAVANEQTLLVIEGIHDNEEKRKWWKQLQLDNRVGITFDLYETGVVFFDLTKQKQHYIVSF